MITIEVVGSDLVLSAGEQQIRVKVPDHFVEKARKGILALDIVGTPRRGAVLTFVGDDPVLIGGHFKGTTGTAGDYKQCYAVIDPAVTMTPGTSYKATAVLTNGSEPSGDPNHTVSFKIEAA